MANEPLRAAPVNVLTGDQPQAETKAAPRTKDLVRDALLGILSNTQIEASARVRAAELLLNHNI